MSNNPHPDRPIATPRRRLNRASSQSSSGSTGAPNTASPLSGFSFNSPPTQSSSAKPPIQPAFGTSFSNASTGFGSSNLATTSPSIGSQLGTGSPINAPQPFATSPAPSAQNFGFSGIGNFPPSPSFGGFGPTSTSSAPASNTGFGNTSGSASGNGAFQIGFGNSSNTASSNLTDTAPTIRRSDSVTSIGSEKSASGTNPPFSFTFKNPSDKENPFGGFGSTSNSTGKALITPFSFGSKPEDASSNLKPTAAPFSGIFGNTVNTTSSSVESSSAPVFSFGKKPEDKASDPKPTSSPSFLFNKPTESTEKSSSNKPFSFGSPATGSDKPTLANTPFSFGNPTTSSDKPASANTPFSFGQKLSDSSTLFNASTSKPTEKPEKSPFTFLTSTATTGADNTEGDKESAPLSLNKAAETTDKAPAIKPFTFGAPSGTFGSINTDKSTSTDTGNSEKEKKSATATTMPGFNLNKPAASGNDVFLFGNPNTTSTGQKPGQPLFTFGTSSNTNKDSVTEKNKETPVLIPSFNFGKPAEGNDKTSSSKAFSFSTPVVSSAADKPATSAPTFAFPPLSTGDKPTSTPTFSFGAIPSAIAGKKRQIERDDEDGPSASKKTFTSIDSSTAPNTVSAPPYTFGLGANKGPTSMPTFSFSIPAKTAEDGGKDTAAASAPKTFNFGSINKEPLEKTHLDSSASKPFSINFSKSTPAETSASTSTNFTFGTPPSKDSSSTIEPAGALKAATSGASTTTISKDNNETVLLSENTSESAKGKASMDTNKTSEKSTPTLSLGTNSNKNATGISNDKNSKKVSFDLPELPSSATVAFSKVGTTESNNSATLNMTPIKKDTTGEGSNVQTTLKSTVTEPNQITYKTRFWELPDDARNELARLAHFISEQTEKHDKIADEINSSFAPTLKEMESSAIKMNKDALILAKQLEVQSESLDELISKSREQRLNAVSASNVQNQETRNWRVRGAAENWRFFTNTVENMEHRIQQFAETIDAIEKAVGSAQNTSQFSSVSIGALVDRQRKMYLGLAGRVAELHQETDRIVKRRKLTK